jgi:hypothetical protein
MKTEQPNHTIQQMGDSRSASEGVTRQYFKRAANGKAEVT